MPTLTFMLVSLTTLLANPCVNVSKFGVLPPNREVFTSPFRVLIQGQFKNLPQGCTYNVVMVMPPRFLAPHMRGICGIATGHATNGPFLIEGQQLVEAAEDSDIIILLKDGRGQPLAIHRIAKSKRCSYFDISRSRRK